MTSAQRPGTSGARSKRLLAVHEAGSGEPLVLIHGLATTHGIWSMVTPALARERRVVTLDIPGFGQSPPVGPGFELGAVADRIARGLAATGVRAPFDLVGHSLGAGIALTLAVRRPRTVRRLVLVAPAGLAGVPWTASLLLAAGVGGLQSARRALVGLTDLRWGRRLLLAFAAADGASISPTQARLMVNASAGAQRTPAAFSAISGADLRPLLERTQAPLGAIWGAEDRTVPLRIADVVRRARPDADIVVIERAGHVCMVEAPDAFVGALGALLDRLPKDATIPASGPRKLA